MGMSGRYLVVTDELIESIKSGEISVHDCSVDLDIDKTWQMLQFTLTGNLAEGEPPLGYVVPMSGNNIWELFGHGSVSALQRTGAGSLYGSGAAGPR